jgi:hypothetical protein
VLERPSCRDAGHAGAEDGDVGLESRSHGL